MIIAVLLLELAVTPQQERKAEELAHASMRDYDLGYFEKALGEAEEAYRLDPLPQILYNIGQCHRALEHWAKAAFFYGRYLSKLPDAPNFKRVADLLAQVQYRLKSEQLKPATAPPPPQPAVALAPPPPPSPAPKAEESVPRAAVEPAVERTAEAPHSHAAAYVLGSVAIASLAVAIVGIVYVQNYESLLDQLNNPTSYPAWQANRATALNEQPHAQAWQWTAGIAGAVALGTGTAAVFTW